MGDEELGRMVATFKVLADESRLRILGILVTTPCTGSELAERLGLQASTVSHHLTRLREVGLVRAERAGTSVTYSLDRDVLAGLGETVLAPAALEGAVADGDDVFVRKVMDAFFDGETLLKIPSSRKKRDVVLERLARDFTLGEPVSEAVVNERLQAHHWDCATLRRELVGGGWMTRADGVYTRLR
ncbi:MAG: metalloregulator ArsR/SmtB family transcription factor [Myxococcales bacterium]|nr:metalloregulator ArsR/SmtB family transcription factor [Myxococcales bacterium]MCA9567610.1 metalloregulator ArsR/SmtB family transcription factor [Myxococcales bacterium]MCB9669865.1 metalloregulator ArsR/SmtB family transcription factor [Alphaproteobacteria bacterium]MCB9693261.1 metalloregulator ArsR/SmtB family transcription factor [Alphaproteobacteria bacterium]